MTERIPNVVDRVEWYEGMLLAPQHFQQMAARLDSLVAWQTLAAAPFSWGVRRLAFDNGLLPTGLVRVLALDAIMPDGTAVSYSADAGQHDALELSLEPFAAQLANGPLDVYVTLPIAAMTRRNPQVRRFRSVAGLPVEDEVSEAPPADIARLVPNLELAAGELPSATYVYLRLASV
ncbi:MAG TPA: type VI secretion system baseplate subunit TssK, partial [Paraburkholderia sp.]